MDQERVQFQVYLLGFNSENIRRATPPGKRGVYVIRIGKMGKPVEQIPNLFDSRINALNQLVAGSTIQIKTRSTHPIYIPRNQSLRLGYKWLYCR